VDFPHLGALNRRLLEQSVENTDLFLRQANGPKVLLQARDVTLVLQLLLQRGVALVEYL